MKKANPGHCPRCDAADICIVDTHIIEGGDELVAEKQCECCGGVFYDVYRLHSQTTPCGDVLATA